MTGIESGTRPRDDLGAEVDLPRRPRRVVSLVPSLTESVAVTHAHLLVGATDWCTHPSDLDVTRVRGTKNPDLDALIALAPDLVLANKEENREIDVRRLRERGVPVWVTDIRSVPEALDSLNRIFTVALGEHAPSWLEEARALWLCPLPDIVARVVVPIWRDPWMVVGSETFTGDLLRRVGLSNDFGAHPDRYPRVDIEDMARDAIDLVLLPDEPYRFSELDGPEVFDWVPTRLISGRLITWYGPSMVEARQSLPQVLIRDVRE